MAGKGVRAGGTMNVCIAVLLCFALLGALDEGSGGRLGVAEAFRQGLSSMGSLCFSMAGIYCIAVTALPGVAEKAERHRRLLTPSLAGNGRSRRRDSAARWHRRPNWRCMGFRLPRLGVWSALCSRSHRCWERVAIPASNAIYARDCGLWGIIACLPDLFWGRLSRKLHRVCC